MIGKKSLVIGAALLAMMNITYAENNTMTNKISFLTQMETVNDNAVPLQIQSFGNSYYRSPYDGLVKEGKLYIESTVLGQLAGYRVKVDPKAKEALMYIPSHSIKEGKVYVERDGVGAYIKIPFIEDNFRYYIPFEDMAVVLGLEKVEIDGQITLKRKEGAYSYEAPKAFTEPVTMVFDPLSKREEAYPRAMKEGSVQIMSPSWFELTAQGVSVPKDMEEIYLAHYKGQSVHIWPLITNQFDPELTHDILENQAMWPKIAGALGSYAQIYGFTGYNFDFENVYYKDKDKLTAFVAYLADYLHGLGLYASMDVTGLSNSERWSKVYDRKALSESLDYMVLMAYDQVGSRTPSGGPVATFPWVKNQVDGVAKIVPPEKLILGVPFYMRIWSKPEHKDDSKYYRTTAIEPVVASPLVAPREEIHGPGPVVKNSTMPLPAAERKALAKKEAKNPPKAKWTSITLSMKKAPIYIKKGEANYYWDDALKLHYTFYSENQKFHRIWFEDEKSLQYKLALVKEYNLAGFAAWRKGFEPLELWETFE